MARILAVDDSPAMRRMLSVTLRSAGHVVLEGSDGREALEIAKSQPPADLVITDINMAEMDGITLLRQLRQLAPYHAVPVLVLTTEASPQKRQQGRDAGATGWLVKPFNPERLLVIVAKLLG